MRTTLKNAGTPNYQVIMAAQSAVNCVNRDKKQFAAYKFPVTEKIEVMENLINRFNSLTPDRWYAKTKNEKTKAIEQVKKQIASDVDKVQNKLKNRLYKCIINTCEINCNFNLQLSAEVFFNRVWVYISQIEKTNGLLSATLANSGIITGLFKKIDKGYLLLQEIEDIKTEQEYMNEQRNLIAEKIYSEIQLIAIIGKAIWFNTNTRKYNNYLLRNFIKRTGSIASENDTGTLHTKIKRLIPAWGKPVALRC